MVKRGLYIGRFQPYHYGHENILKEISYDVEEIIIGIGSSQESHTIKNPFTCGERIEMIKHATNNIKNVKYIIPYQDISYNSIWSSYIKSTSPKFDIVYSNNPIVTQLFQEDGLIIKKTKMYNRKVFSGTYIRKLMFEKNDEWKKYVPKSISRFINSINGISRIINVEKKDF